MAKEELTVTVSPHIKSGEQISTAMRDVALALLPVVLVGIGFFRLYAIVNLAAGILTAIACEWVMRKIMGKEPSIGDWSAVVTGMFVALIVPPTVPFWYVMIGTAIAVALVKELMGGLGYNLFNPALFGFVSLLTVSRIFALGNRALNLGGIYGITGATPLVFIRGGVLVGIRPSYIDVFIAHPGGSMAECSVLAVLIGGAYLLYRGHITWHIPASIIGTVFILTAILGENPLYMILAGGLMFGSFFMATDWVTSPDNRVAQIVYGVLIGVLVVVIRLFGAPTGAVAYSILIGNCLTPLLNRVFIRRKFGAVKSAPAGEKAA